MNSAGQQYCNCCSTARDFASSAATLDLVVANLAVVIPITVAISIAISISSLYLF